MAAVLVTGGTGRLGKLLVPELAARGHDVRVLSRRRGAGRVVGDLATGAGVDDAVRGVQTIVHAATSQRMNAVDVEGTARLAAAARGAGVAHLVYVSIVGVDANPFRYYRAKLAAERRVSASGVEFTLARGTQFFDLVAGVLDRLRLGPLLFAPAGWQLQPCDVAQFAVHLAERVDAGPSAGVTEFGGPVQASTAQLAAEWHRAHGRSGPIRQLPVPGRASAAFRAGAQIPGPFTSRGTRTFADWLATRPTS
ncbi:MAG: SDR family oxidoreductase [Jatrophihabitantaceae bacterium]